MVDQWQEQLPYYVTGRLSVTQRTALEAHLAGCAACRERLGEWRLIASTVQKEASARSQHLPPLDHARYLTKPVIRLTATANGSQPAHPAPLPEVKQERKKDMAISSLPRSVPRGYAQPNARSGNIAVWLLAGLFILTLCVGFANLNNQLPTPGSNNVGVLPNGTGTPTGTLPPPPATPTHRPTIVPPTFDPSVTPPTRPPTIIPPTFDPSATPACLRLIVVPGFEEFFERLAAYLREHGICVILVYPTPRPTGTPGASPTPRSTIVPPTFDPSGTPPATPTRRPTIVPPTFDPSGTPPATPTRPPTIVPPTFPPPPTHPVTFTPIPSPTRPPTQVPPTFPPPPATPTRPPTQVPPTNWPTFTPPPTFPPPPATPTRPPTQVPPTFPPPPNGTFPPPPTFPPTPHP